MTVRKAWGFSEDQIIIISVGNCSEIKNHSDILRAISQLTTFEKNIIYFHVGEGESFTEELNLSHKLGIENYVKFAGKVDNIREALICSDIFIMTSLLEGVGIASLEAGSCGLPLLIYDSPGLRESVIDGFNGLLVKQDYNNLVNGLKKLISNEELRILYGKNARKFVQENFSMVDSVNKLINLYLN